MLGLAFLLACKCELGLRRILRGEGLVELAAVGHAAAPCVGDGDGLTGLGNPMLVVKLPLEDTDVRG